MSMGIVSVFKQLQMSVWDVYIKRTEIELNGDDYTVEFELEPNSYLSKRIIQISICKVDKFFVLKGTAIINHVNTCESDIVQKIYEQFIKSDLSKDCFIVYNLIYDVYHKVLACL